MYTTLGIMILAWTVISIGWFLKNMGYPHRKEGWIDWILLLPTLLIAYMFRAMVLVFDIFKRND